MQTQWRRTITYRIWVTVLCAIGLTSISSCNLKHPTETMLADYIQRLANITELEPNPLTQRSIPPFPRRSERRLLLTEFRIGLWDYLGLQDCPLSQVLAQRNSNLGRVMPPSRRFLYELDVIEAIEQCDASLKTKVDSTPLNQELQTAKQTKRTELILALWNAIYADEEFEHLFSNAVQPLALGENEPLTLARQALIKLIPITDKTLAFADHHSKKPQFDPAALEAPLQSLDVQQASGRMLLSTQLTTAYLNQASELLERSQKQHPLCPMQKKTTRGQYLHNVFIKYYAGDIQPYLSLLHRDGRALLQTQETLYRRFEAVAPASFKAYARVTILIIDSDTGIWHDFQHAMRRHTHAWQAVLKSCQLMPSGNAS